MNLFPKQKDFYICGGAVRPDAPSYICRTADAELLDGIQAGEFCYVLTSRQMGKTSLMIRTIQHLRGLGWKVADVDLTTIGNRGQGQNDDAWYFTIAIQITEKLGLEINLEKWWDERLRTTPIHRLIEFFRLLAHTFNETPIALFLDEIDCTIHLPFTDDFFACIRACYNLKAQEKQFQHLSFTLLGSAIPSDLIQDKTRTPFNIGGKQIILDDFTSEQALPLVKGLLFKPHLLERAIERVLYWTSGHPYLTQRLLYEISTYTAVESIENVVDEVASRVFIDPPIQRAERNIVEVRRYLTSKDDWLEKMKGIYRLIRQDQRVDDDPLSPAISYLKLSGLVKIGEAGQLVVRNKLYERAFADWEIGDAIYKITSDRRLVTRKVELQEPIQYTTAKIVLVGDSGVGKTGLGWRLAHGEFREHASTHGQQFWVVNELGLRRQDGTECEAILWDFAGQPDYRLIHGLFLADADLALVLFDPNDSYDPLHGVEFWLKQLKTEEILSQSQNDCQIILVGARADRGESRLTQDELDEFCRQRGILGGHVMTSAKDGIGIDELLLRMKAQVPWEQKMATTSSLTFKRIRDYVLQLKEGHQNQKVIISPQDLQNQLSETDKTWQFSGAEMMTAIGNLANYGYVQVLRTSKGEECILLVPELLNNLAASFVLEARRNWKGLGSLEEKRLLAGEYQFRELEKRSWKEREVLLDSAALLFLEHNICFRETDPLTNRSYLVFPELINLKKPLLENEMPTEDGAGYTVSGAVENVYASLVLLLGYTQTFTRTNQWQGQARYEMGDGLICGFRQDNRDRDGELNLVLYFGTNVGKPVRSLFQGLFESFLARRNLSVFRYEPVVCSNGHPINRAVVRGRLRDGKDFAFCEDCGDRVILPRAYEPIQLTQAERRKVDEQQWFAAQRSRFEQAVFQVMSYVSDQKLVRPECFISYAWGDREQERWVERNLATDLQKAGIGVVLDRWENSRVGSSVPRFIERIEKCDLILMVGTPLYRNKFEKKELGTGYVVAAEVDLITERLLGTEPKKETVLPLLLAGEKETSLPPLLHSRVYADFRNERGYFVSAFDLILDLYGINHNHQAVADLRESLRERELR